MKLGFGLPNIGPVASPDAIIKVSKRAEELGYDSLWVVERLLNPLNPQTPYPGTPDGSLPQQYRSVLDPLQVLSFAAANTSRVSLGTSVLVMGYRNPLVLAQSLTAIDVLSGGRLIVGFGQGWSKDEFDVVGTSMASRAGMADEFLHALKAVWTDNPVEFQGNHFQIPPSYIDIKPVQKPHPPIFLAAYAPAAMQRVATLGDGWMPAGIPIEGMAQMMEGIREMASQSGRDPSELKMIVRANIEISDRSAGAERAVFSGTLDEIKADITRVKDMGADEVFLDPLFSPEAATAEGILGVMEQFKPSALDI